MAPFDGVEPLVPLLPVETGRVDPDVLATWHQALSSALAPDLPHDLLAIWLYTPEGPVLLAPEALAADALVPPPAAPHVASDALEAFREIFVRARYQSTLCQPVAYGRADVALLVVADLRPGLASDARQALLLDAAQQLAPTLARLARNWQAPDAPAAEAVPGADAGALLGKLGGAQVTEASVGGVLRALFSALAADVPHDAAEVLVRGAQPTQWLRLSGHERGPLWHAHEIELDADVPAALGLHDSPLPVQALRLDLPAPWKLLLPSLTSAPGSAVAARLALEGRTVGYLVLASGDRDLYGERERRLLAAVAPFLAARVEALVLSADLAAARARAASLQAVPTQLHKLTGLLATTRDTAAALREVVAEATALLPFHRVRFAVRLGATDRVAFVLPGETRAFADLPQAPIGTTLLEAVLQGERPYAADDTSGDREWIFPLRVSGETIGALLLAMQASDRLSNVQLAIAQQLADMLAPYLELRRRPYVRAPFTVGWKRSPSVPES